MDTSLEAAIIRAIESFNYYLQEVNPTPNYTMTDYKNAFFQRLSLNLKQTNHATIVACLKGHNIRLEIADNKLSQLCFVSYKTYTSDAVIELLNKALSGIRLSKLGSNTCKEKMDNVINSLKSYSWNRQVMTR